MVALLLATSLSSGPAAAASGTCPKWEPLFRRYGLPVATFSRIAWRESRCNPKSVSATRRSTGRPDVGLLQIQGSWRTVTLAVCRPKGSHIVALTDPVCNVRVARYLYDHGGLGHWKGSSR